MPTIICTFSFRRQANDPEEASADADADADTDAATGKVKEAVLKSLDQGTIVIETSARSAAKLAGDAMDTTAKKLQKTLGKQSEAELWDQGIFPLKPSLFHMRLAAHFNISFLWGFLLVVLLAKYLTGWNYNSQGIGGFGFVITHTNFIEGSFLLPFTRIPRKTTYSCI